MPCTLGSWVSIESMSDGGDSNRIIDGKLIN